VAEPAQAKMFEDLLLMKVSGCGLMSARRQEISPRCPAREVVGMRVVRLGASGAGGGMMSIKIPPVVPAEFFGLRICCKFEVVN